MTNPFDVVAPKAPRLSQFSVSMNSLIKNIAWELGQLYNVRLSALDGSNWLAELSQARGSQISVHDPSFVFAEPEHYSSSPVWEALPPRTTDLVGQFRRARITRNKWEHDTAAQGIHTYRQGIQNYRDLSRSLKLPTEGTCNQLLIRVDELKRGKFPAPRLDVSDELKKVAAEAVAEAKRAQERLDSMRASAEESEAARTAAALEVERAKEQLASLERQLQLAQQEQRLSVSEPAEALTPGDEWTFAEIGTRQLNLKKNMVDLFDQEQGVLLSDEFGPVATQAASRWLGIMPKGGAVWLTPGGHAAGRVSGKWIYLGRLDLVSAGFEPGAVSALAPSDSSFEVTEGNDIRALETDVLLSDFVGAEVAANVAERLSTSLEIEELFHLTGSNVAVVQRGGQWIQLSEIAPAEWFGDTVE